MTGDGERVVLQALRGAARTDPDTQVRLNLYATLSPLLQALRGTAAADADAQVLTCADVCADVC
jgi:hypothetical protein